MLLFSNCGRSREEESIEQKSKEISKREQELLAWEQRLQSKEDSLISREQLLDSAGKQSDSINVFNPALTGNWNVKMVCIQTTCEGSAIGDTKTERWNISYKENSIIVNATFNNKLIRVYEGVHVDNGIQLLALPQPEAVGTVIKVTLRTTKENRMEGLREINQGDKCRIIYSLELEKL